MYKSYAAWRNSIRSKQDSDVKQDEGAKRKEGPSRRTITSRTSSMGSALSRHMQADARFGRIICGDTTIRVPTNAKIVRIFTSSTFTDTQHERNALIERVYPGLLSFCQQRGYDFQVVDMRWGIREASTDDHMTTDLCLQELRACKKLSTGPNFVTFLSHKNGYCPLPRAIEASQFHLMMQKVTDKATPPLFQKWYKMDANAVPAAYILQPISTHYPEYINKNEKEAYAKARDFWWTESELMQHTLKTVAKKIDPHNNGMAQRFQRSVTETEIVEGLVQDQDADDHCLWFKREISNIEEQEKSKLLSRYIECVGPRKLVTEARQSVKDLKQKLTGLCSPNNILEYAVPWTEKAINPNVCQEHKAYIDKLCEDFDVRLRKMITKGIEERERSGNTDPLVMEILQHTKFCQDRCSAFYGRRETMQRLESYMSGGTAHPFVLYGKSGCGKTSIMAMAAKKVEQLMQGEPVLVLRFLGTTPNSSNIQKVLHNIVSQIKHAYGDFTDTPGELRELVKLLPEALKMATEERPLVVILDSLDQLDPTFGARQLSWLPRILPPHVRCLLSTLPDERYQCFPTLKTLLNDESLFLEVPQLSVEDVQGILGTWLKLQNRTLTSQQQSVVETAFKHCPLPLFLKICFDEACQWPSYLPPDKAILKTSIRDAINTLLHQVERIHGFLLVSHALAYMTLSRSGLSENELEDILSCDDEVLGDVYQYWEPPLRRLPPLLLVRVKSALHQYLVNRGADGIHVISWYHRQFFEAAETRYCSALKEKQQFHKSIAEYFLGKWADGNAKPYTDKSGKSAAKERYVSSQPYTYNKHFNIRKFMELPRHLILCGDVELLKKEMLCNYDWLSHKLKATSIREIRHDYDEATQQYPDDKELQLLDETFQLSYNALKHDPHQLPGQLIGRITKGVEKLLESCLTPNYPALVPDEPCLVPPGGQLVHLLCEHTDDVHSVHVSSDNKYAATCSYDKKVNIWDLEYGRLERTLEDVAEGMETINFCCGDEYLIVTGMAEREEDEEEFMYVIIINFATGEVHRRIPGSLDGRSNILDDFVLYNQGHSLAIYTTTAMHLYELPSGREVATVTHGIPAKTPEELTKCRSSMGGYNRYIAVTTTADPKAAFVFDSLTKQFLPRIQVLDEESDSKHWVFSVLVTRCEDFVIAVDMYSTCLYFYSIESGHIVKQLEGNMLDETYNLQISPDDKHLYFVILDKLCIWNIKEDKKMFVAKHPSHVDDVATNDLVKVVTVSSDNIVRIWDMARDPDVDDHVIGAENEQELNLEVIDVKKVSPSPLSWRFCCVRLEKMTKDGRVDSLAVYDFQEKRHLRQTLWSDLSSISHLTLIDNTQAVYIRDRRLHLLDLDQMRTTARMPVPVQVSPHQKYIEVFPSQDGDRKCVTVAEDGGSIVLHNLSTQDTIHIHPQQGHLSYMDDVKISADGRYAVSMTDVLLVFDLQRAAYAHTIVVSKSVIEGFSSLVRDSIVLTYPDHLIVGVTALRQYPNERLLDTPYVAYPVLLDIVTGKVKHQFLDKRAERLYLKSGGDMEFKLLPQLTRTKEDNLITSHEDQRVRIWSLQTGSLLWKSRLQEHALKDIILSVDPSESRYLIVHYGLEMWDIQTKDIVAQFQPDTKCEHFLFVGGDTVLMWMENQRVVTLTLKKDVRPKRSTYKPQPQAYKGQELSLQLVLD